MISRHQRNGFVKGLTLAAVVACNLVVQGASSGQNRPSSAADVVGRELGSVDPLISDRIAQRVGVQSLIDLIYRGPDHLRLPAIEALGSLEHPWPALPTLAALSTARERPVASAASRALLMALGNWSRRQRLAGSEVIAPEAAALAKALRNTAKDPRLDVDIRGAALRGLLELERAGFAITPLDPTPLLEEDDLGVRALGVAAIALPISDESLLTDLAHKAQDETDPVLRGQIVGLLCENALIQNARRPSKDLESLIAALFDDKDFAAEAFAPALACLSEFPTDARVDLLDLALSRSDEKISKLWDRLTGEN